MVGWGKTTSVCFGVEGLLCAYVSKSIWIWMAYGDVAPMNHWGLR